MCVSASSSCERSRSFSSRSASVSVASEGGGGSHHRDCSATAGVVSLFALAYGGKLPPSACWVLEASSLSSRKISAVAHASRERRLPSIPWPPNGALRSDESPADLSPPGCLPRDASSDRSVGSSLLGSSASWASVSPLLSSGRAGSSGRSRRAESPPTPPPPPPPPPPPRPPPPPPLPAESFELSHASARLNASGSTPCHVSGAASAFGRGARDDRTVL